MRRITTIAAATGLLFGGAALAADPKAEQQTKQGDGALMFTLGGLFTSTPSLIDGVGVGGRYFTSESMALRAALGFSHGSVETETGNNSQTDSNTNFAIEGGVEFPIFKKGPVYIYAGGVAQVLVGSTDKESNNTETSTTGFAVAGAAGANYFFDDSMSIGAEYRLGVANTSTESKPKGGGTKTTTSDFEIGTGAVGFHLAFWF
jgi:hypothetical protein